jgi:hypothetical protein
MASESRRALRQVLAWGTEQGMSIRGLLSAEQLEELSRVFAGADRFSFELYEPLRAFAHAVPRLELPDVPARIHFGDALSALAELLAESTPAWPQTTMPSPGTFAELGYLGSSAAITRLREQHTATWRQHAEHNKQLLRRAAELGRGESAAVIGAGKVYDIPVAKLAERYARLTLIDVDGDALAESVRQAGLSPKLRERVRLVTCDVTGSNQAFLERAHSCFESPTDEATYAALLATLHSYRLAAPPVLAEGGPFDAVFSSMVLSQLATPLTEYAQRRFAERFPESSLLAAREFQIALAQFTHRMQHDHVQALLAAAPLVALTSDVSEQFVQVDANGKTSPTSPELPLIGAPHLEDLFPAQQVRIVESASWQWQRVPATTKSPRGRSLKVIGTIAERL